MADIPHTTKGRDARVRADDFSIPLPPSPIGFSGRLKLDESILRLRMFYGLHRELMRNLAGMLIGVPEFETKIELSHHIFLHSEYAAMYRRRLWELRVKESALDEVPERPRLLASELLYAPDTSTLLHGYALILNHIAAAQDDYLSVSDPVLDRPSRSIIRRLSTEFSNAQDWISAACKGYSRTQEASRSFTSRMKRLIEGVEGGEPPDDAQLPYHRPTACARDDRFSVFHHTRNYERGPEDSADLQAKYEADRFELVRVQRDELDAIETFANVLFDLKEAPFSLLQTLARFVEDESRHAEAGQIALRELGYDPFSVPCSVIGINVRASMPPALAFAQINIFGELNIVSRLRRLALRAKALDDEVFDRMFDFIHADELSHVRIGRRILKELASNGNVGELQENARRLAARRLAEEGVVDEDYALKLTSKEIFDIMGE
jgi:hypothetical protein